jgi:nuclear pore complex protein Nup205
MRTNKHYRIVIPLLPPFQTISLTTSSSDEITLFNGSTIKIPAEHLASIDQISNLLNVSQLLAAALAVQSENLKSHYPNRSTPEIATYIFHTYLSQLLDFLIDFLHFTSGPILDISPPFDDFRERLQIIIETRRPAGEGFLVDGILEQLDAIQRRIQVLLGRQGVTGAEYELLSFRVQALRVEQGKMGRVLMGICEGGWIGRKQVLKLLDWLRKRDRVDSVVEGVVA